MARMLLSLDARVFPNAVDEAAMNLNKAQAIDPANPEIRVIRAQVVSAQRHMAAPLTATEAGPALAMPENSKQHVEVAR
jgi:hypothetical protein